MSARRAGILLLVLLLTPAAEAGWFSGNTHKKKLPRPIKMAEIRPHDAARLNKPSKLSSKFLDPSWGALGKTFHQPWRMRVSHQNEF